MPSLKALGPRSRGPVAFPDLHSLLDSEGGRGGPPAGRSAWQEAQGPGSGERLKWLPLACRVTVAAGRSTSRGLCSLRSAGVVAPLLGRRVRAGFEVSGLQIA